MGKRKLRNCAKCGTRQGPPTGKGCTRTETENIKRIEDEAAEFDFASKDAYRPHDVVSQQGEETTINTDQGNQKTLETMKRPICNKGAFVNYSQLHEADEPDYDDPDQTQGPSGSQQRWPRPSTQLEARSIFEKSMSERMKTMENLLGRVACIQQCQLERRIHVSNHPSKAATSTEKKKKSEERTHAEEYSYDKAESEATDD